MKVQFTNKRREMAGDHDHTTRPPISPKSAQSANHKALLLLRIFRGLRALDTLQCAQIVRHDLDDVHAR